MCIRASCNLYKRKIADKQKINDANNISGRSREIHLALSSGNGTGK